jgi:Fur family iron response transcriptional regulator
MAMVVTMTERPFTEVVLTLKQCGLRPTRQRMALARLLRDAGDCHLTAEQLHEMAAASGCRISLATVYNALHQFTDAGLVREIVVDSGCSYFDTNISDHHHFFFEDRRELKDIDGGDVVISTIPEPPEGARLERVDVVIRVRSS